MPRYLVLADDWTGTLECGALLQQREVPTVAYSRTHFGSSGHCADTPAIVISTNSRHTSANESLRIHEELMVNFKEIRWQFLYKKTDSTLRGNIGSEIESLCRCFPGKPILYVPAYPRLGRICRKGNLFVEGRLLAESFFARDPMNPARESSVIRMLEKQTPLPAISVENACDLADWLAGRREQTILVCDGETENDLDEWAKQVKQMEPPWLLAGPAGFLNHILEVMGHPLGPAPGLPPIHRSLWISGSLHPQTLEQIARAEKAGIPILDLPISAASDFPSEKREQFRARGRQMMDEHSHLILRFASPAKLDTEGPAGEGHIPSPMTPLKEFGKLAGEFLVKGKPDLTGIFGGDTTEAVLSQLGDPAIYPLGQILDGIVLSTLSLPPRKVTLLTKAGGFGPAELIPWILGSDQIDSGTTHPDRGITGH